MIAPFGAFGDQAAHPVGHQLEQDAEGAGLLEDARVIDDLAGLRSALALEPEPAEGARALRRQPQVADDRDARPGDAGDPIGHLGAALQLHRVAARLGHEAAGVADRGLDARLVAHVGHVAHHPGVGRTPAHRGRVADHVVHGDRQRAVEPQHRHAQAVPDQDHVHAGLVLEVRGRVVVARQPRDRGPRRRLGDEGRQGHPFALGHRGLLCSARIQRPRSLARRTGPDRALGPEIG